MKSFMVSLLGLVLSVSVGAEPLLKGRVWLASGPPAAGVQVRLFDLTDLRRSVGTTTDEAGYFALRLQAFSTAGRPALPQDFALGQNYPNPFNPSTIIPYQIPTTTHVRLEVFNLLGQRLATLVDGERPAGAHTAQWDATDAAGRAVGAGVFIYRLTGGGHTVSRRMVLIDGQAGIPAGAAGPRRAPALERTGAEGAVYGLTVAGTGLIAYVNPAFRVGTDRVDLVLEQPGGQARMKVATGGILGDVNNDSQVDAFDVLYVALYSKDPSITLPNNGDISLGDVNGDGTVDLADGLLLALYTVNPSDPTLPPGIGQPVDGSGDDHGDTPSSATALAVGSSRSGQLEPGGDVDYFRVEVSASGELTVHTTGNLDTKGQLEDSTGGVLASDDDGGDGYNFRLAHAVSAGTYYIKVEGYDATTTGSYTIHASGPGGGPVNIPDANLRAAIAAELGKAPNAPITPDEMATLTDLDARDQGIRDLTGLEFATNLTFLVLSSNAISDVSPLSGLTNLTQLWLGTNAISDISPLSGLTNLTGLALSINAISDISPLSGLTNLTFLVLSSNAISDVSPLSGLTNLTGLALSINAISDISPLSGLTNLTWLYLNDNSISDISPLVANTGLGSGDEVYLVNNPLSSTSLNTHIPALESRGVTVHLEYEGDGDDHGDTPSSATALAVGSSQSGQLETGGDVDYFRVEVTASGELTVHTTGSLDTKGQLEDSAGGVLARDDDGGDGYNFRLAHSVSAGTYYIKVEGYDATTTGSYTIHASGPGGGDGGPVNIPDANLRAAIAEDLGKAPNAPITEGEMATLTFLEAPGQGIRDLTGLEFATNLTELELYSNAISDVSPLSGLTNLTYLYLWDNTISDLSPLSGLTNLTGLGLSSNAISDVSPLSGLTNLTWLSLDDNTISDVSPLSGLTNLTWLSLDDNTISDISPLVANTGLGSGDEVYLVNNPLSSTSLNTHIPALESRGVTVYLEYLIDGDDHGDTPSSASALAVGSSQSGQLETGGDVDYFRVEVSASGELTVHTTGSLDTRGQLEDSAGGVLARDDDGGDGFNFRLAHSVSAGTYYIKVEGYDATTTGRYTIHASGPGGDGGPVNIPDANLRAVIAEALGKAPNAPITEGEMATLTGLGARDQGIRDLTGLEFATNLESLDLSEKFENGIVINSNDVSNLSPLSGLTKLWWIGLDTNNISDLSPLASLNNLRVLYIGRNNISDLSPLSGLNNLADLYLWDNNISDLSPLASLNNLVDLYVGKNNISDLSPLASLNNLADLSLADNTISDISPLVANTGLGSGDEVTLYNNPLSSTSRNTHIPALESRGVTVHYDGSAKVIAGDAKSSMQGRMNAPRSERFNRKSAR